MDAARQVARSPGSRAGVRKVTYSLPARLVSELDRRAVQMAMSKSAVVANALALYFAERDHEALAKTYEEAAKDPLFQADNEAVLQDFAALDAAWQPGLAGCRKWSGSPSTQKTLFVVRAARLDLQAGPIRERAAAELGGGHRDEPRPVARSVSFIVRKETAMRRIMILLVLSLLLPAAAGSGTF